MSRYTTFSLSDCAKRQTFCTSEVLPQRRGEISTVLTPCRKFSNRRSVSFSRSVKLSPDVATPNIKGRFSIIFKSYSSAKVRNIVITNTIITNKIIIAMCFLYPMLLWNTVLLIITTTGEATRESGTKSRRMSMRWLHREESYSKTKNNHYLRINIQDAEHHLSGRLCSEGTLT